MLRKVSSRVEKKWHRFAKLKLVNGKKGKDPLSEQTEGTCPAFTDVKKGLHKPGESKGKKRPPS